MSVYTTVDTASLNHFLADYPLGDLQDCQGIAAGIENTNYRLTTSRGRYILTLFESTAGEHISFALQIMSRLAGLRDYFARPVQNHHGKQLSVLANKPATLVTCLAGHSLEQAHPEHCRQIGTALAHFHRDGERLGQLRQNPRGLEWRSSLAAQIRPALDKDEQALLDDELAYQDSVTDHSLQRGIIHGDLFRDNALFVGDRLSGIIDLYNCGRDVLLYDLAITANDWCCREDGRFDSACLTTLLSAYHQTRPVSGEEMDYWPTALRAAALRFWMSRLRNVHFPRSGQLTVSKDPAVFQSLLLHHREDGNGWPL